MGRRASICNRTHSFAAGVAPDRIYEDLASGRHDMTRVLGWRHVSRPCMKDTLVVWKLDRLGRNLRHLVTLVETLHQREVGLVVTGQGAQVDTTTANGRLVFGIFAALAEFETELIRERTRAGLAAARAPGAAGRPAAQNDKSRCAWPWQPWWIARQMRQKWRLAS